jgi:DNA-binding NtrC family response regulator
MQSFDCVEEYLFYNSSAASTKGIDMPKVLVVDDQEDFLSIIGQYLHANGIEIHLAQCASEARKHLTHCAYDLVISDLQMPGESGLDLFRFVSSRHPGLPFILMSGNLDPRLIREAMNMGICCFLEKPFELSYLKRFITDPDLCAPVRGRRKILIPRSVQC